MEFSFFFKVIAITLLIIYVLLLLLNVYVELLYGKHMYSSQNHWVCRPCPLSGILNTRAAFRKLDLLPSSNERTETPALLGPF
jgi:hypothetical protein